MNKHNSGFLDTNSWQAISMADSINSLEKPIGPDDFLSRAFFEKDVTVLDMYCYLKGRFGNPNGYLNITINEDSKINSFYWHYHIKTSDSVLHIIGMLSKFEIRILTKRKVTIDEWKEFTNSVKKDFNIYSKSKNKEFKRLKKWTLFINPYKRLKISIESLNLKLNQIGPPDDITSNVALERSKESNIHELVVIGLSLKFLIPVFAESFINMLIMFFLDRKTKSNNIKMMEIFRSDLIYKLKYLHTICQNKITAVDFELYEVKQFQTLMNQRNDFLHGNVDPTRLILETIYFDNNIPLYKEAGNIISRIYKNNLKHIEPAIIKENINTVNNFCIYILKKLEKNDSKSFLEILNCMDPGWNHKEGDIQAVLPDLRTEILINEKPDYIDSEKKIKQHKNNDADWKYFTNFMNGLAAASQLLKRAEDQGFYIEYICLVHNIIDSTLRIGIILQHQLDTHSNELLINLIYCTKVSERAILDMAKSRNILSEGDFISLVRLHNRRNEILQSYITSDITTNEILKIVTDYQSLLSCIKDTIYEIEERQIELGIGMTVSDGDIPDSLKENLQGTIEKMAEAKHSNSNLSRLLNPQKNSNRSNNSIRSNHPKKGRNNMCDCGSGRKYKKCCLYRT